MASDETAAQTYSNLLIVLPNWVGDVVLATPALRAIRELLETSRITYLMRPYVQDVLHGCPWVDDVVLWPESGGKVRTGLWRFAGGLRQEGYDSVLLLTNSFRTAVISWLTRAPRRIGYARDYRSFLLTDRLQPQRHDGRFTIESMLTYYDRLARHVGCPGTDGPLELHTDAESDVEVTGWWRDFGVSDGQPVVVMNPGSKFGASKLYPLERFARVGDMLAGDAGCRIVITAGPAEIEIAETVRRAMQADAAVLAPPRLNLRRLKSVIARSSLLITNDTGPRHFAIAFGVPVVTIFGPTHPGWTETNCAHERKVMIPVDCGPCQKPLCPLDHRCMTGITPETVVEQAEELLSISSGDR